MLHVEEQHTHFPQNTHFVHGEVRVKECVVDAPESCKKIYILQYILYQYSFLTNCLSDTICALVVTVL